MLRKAEFVCIALLLTFFLLILTSAYYFFHVSYNLEGNNVSRQIVLCIISKHPGHIISNPVHVFSKSVASDHEGTCAVFPWAGLAHRKNWLRMVCSSSCDWFVYLFCDKSQIKKMNTVLACLIVLLTASQTLAEEMEFNEDSYWPYSDQIQADFVEGPVFERYLLRPERKPKSEVFYTSMGKRNSEKRETSLKRNKVFFGLMSKKGSTSGNDFIGLMGKRTLTTGKDFVGLMGKRALTSGNNFNGLMGKRALTSESEERMNDLYFSRRRK
ncbi:uncharacterized protein LOC108720096 isoform X2 [Xenopus laevis]|uniref:Uncharacterized protein LOC108720096 isoform X2 n=2 Tax=Xenopus laevis TaxID=8355 RepID=A0A8J0VQJ7_XENLA|nr:uncharacterized protein LOC108720096 isoform X2 [Xenopus laevis]